MNKDTRPCPCCDGLGTIDWDGIEEPCTPCGGTAEVANVCHCEAWYTHECCCGSNWNEEKDDAV
jgi:hypothetical protein